MERIREETLLFVTKSKLSSSCPSYHVCCDISNAGMQFLLLSIPISSVIEFAPVSMNMISNMISVGHLASIFHFCSSNIQQIFDGISASTPAFFLSLSRTYSSCATARF